MTPSMCASATSSPVYLDYQATTPVDPAVLEAMLPFLNGKFGNPHSHGHSHGWEAAAAVRRARGQVADLIGAGDDDIVFTSGATESCNLALRGVARAAGGTRRRIVTVETEHPAVLETAIDLKRAGHEIEIVPVEADGLLDLDRLASAVDARTLLVSVMTANNEIGVIQPIAEIARLCRGAGALLHTDATQAAGRMPMSVDDWDVDLLSMSSHKVYGPKGVGALYVRPGTPIEATTTGGGQEGGLRAGTVPSALAVGFGEACEIAGRQGDTDAHRMAALADRLLAELRRIRADMRLFGHAKHRLPGSLCVGFPGISGDVLVQGVGHLVSLASGSACASASVEPSHVLLALGSEPETAATGVRISLGRSTTDRDIEVAATVLSDFVRSRAY